MGKQLIELSREGFHAAAFFHRCECAWMKWLVRIVASGEVFDLGSQWRRNRNYHCPSRLATDEANFISIKIDILPSKPSEITEALAGVEAEIDQASPFITCDFKNALNLRNRKAAPTIRVAQFGDLHAGRWIFVVIF